VVISTARWPRRMSPVRARANSRRASQRLSGATQSAGCGYKTIAPIHADMQLAHQICRKPSSRANPLIRPAHLAYPSLAVSCESGDYRPEWVSRLGPKRGAPAAGEYPRGCLISISAPLQVTLADGAPGAGARSPPPACARKAPARGGIPSLSWIPAFRSSIRRVRPDDVFSTHIYNGALFGVLDAGCAERGKNFK
jgi:hypothetical protein